MSLLLIGLCCNTVLAQAADSLREKISHSTWNTREGAPRGVTSLAQTKDGYLWIGTTLGLYRFDGLVCTPYPTNGTGTDLPGHNITALASDSTGGLWVGFDHRGLSHIERRGFTNFLLPAPYQAASINGIFCCNQHSAWVLNGSTILRLRGSTWEDFGLTHGLLRDKYLTLFFDHKGDIWTSAKDKVYVLLADAARFEQVRVAASTITQFAESPDGAIWISDGGHSVRPLYSVSPNHPVLLQGTAAILFDPTDHLWVAHDGRGLERLSHADRLCTKSAPETFTSASGLTSNLTHALLRDWFGNIWVGTEMGIDRFRPRSFQPFGEQGFKFSPALAEASDGSVWIQEQNRRLLHIYNGQSHEVGTAADDSPLAADFDGGVWRLHRARGRLEHYSRDATSPALFRMPSRFKNALAQNLVARPDGSLLSAFEGDGLWFFSAGQWKEVQDVRLPQATPTSFAQIGSTTWIGYFDNHLGSWDNGTLKTYGSVDGLDVDTILTTVSGASSVWVGGTNGVAFLKDGKFHPLQVRAPERLRGVSGIEFDGEGSMWLNTGFGAMRLRAEEVAQLLKNPGHAAISSVFGGADGVIGISAQTRPLPSLAKDGAGYLWFGTAGSLVRVNPMLLTPPRPLPALDIQNVIVNGQPVAPPAGVNRPLKLDGRRENRIEFDYTAVDLDHPNHIVYRYRLEGEDLGWQLAGRSKQALYMNLHPGAYRFRLEASNGEDKWVEIAAPYLFAVQPAFYQTKLFFCLCTAAGLLLLWLLYLLRVQYISAAIKQRIEQRSSERLRIARELHDTLLQSIHGLMVRFHYAAESLQQDDPSRPLLEAALRRADALILEGRNRVQDLRGESDNGRTLSELLIDVLEQFRHEASATIQITQEGPPRRLRPVVQDEFCRIGGECILNALQHEQALHISTDIVYGRRFFRLRCRDDGRGLSADVIRAGHRSGHWGLRGMEERANSLGAKLSIWTAPDNGTEVEVRLPATAAYEPEAYRDRLRFFFTKAGKS